ncbi:MAG: hypothetical protein RMJ15_06430 [Nitrososphaerota archaeon]|nr:hypothetical protein [Candidatus Bathyarchaeota archaeon]MDW8023355.1 hypothetical protein [Nitrososphaerota archaeon]
MLVNPCEVVEVVKKVPRGKLTTIVEICKKLAKKYMVKLVAPLQQGFS